MLSRRRKRVSTPAPGAWRHIERLNVNRQAFDPKSASKDGSDSLLMQFSLTVDGESVGNRHHGSWNNACAERAVHSEQ